MLRWPECSTTLSEESTRILHVKSQKIFLTALMALLIPAAVCAQSTSKEPDVNELQKQLQEMHEQMTS